MAKDLEEVCLKDEEELIDLLIRCKIKGFKVMLCHLCSEVFNKKGVKDFEKVKPQQPRKDP